MQRFFSRLVFVFCAAVSMIGTATASAIIQPSFIQVQNVGTGDTTISVTFTKPDGSTFEPPVQNSGDPPLGVTYNWNIPGTLSWTAIASATSPLIPTDPPNGFFGSWLTAVTVQNVGSTAVNITLEYQNHGSATTTGIDAIAELAYDFACVPAPNCAVPGLSSDVRSATILGNTQDGLPTGDFGGPAALSSSASGPLVMNVPPGQTSAVYFGSYFAGSAAQSTTDIELQGSVAIVSIEAVPLPGAVWLLSGVLAVLSRYRRAA